MKLSIVVPCYEMGGRGVYFLDRLFKTVYLQECDKDDFEVIVSDHSENDKISDYMLGVVYNSGRNVTYLRNREKRGSSSANINNAISEAKGDYIKPIFQDDRLYTTEDISIILENLKHDWLIHPYIHYNEGSKTYYNSRTPAYNSQILEGVNTIGPPTCVVFKNDNNYFDENLIWLMDCEFYHRLHLKYGHPHVVDSGPISVNTVWSGQISNTLINHSLIEKETNYIKEKYDSYRDL